jgi:hypothetical protein
MSTIPTPHQMHFKFYAPPVNAGVNYALGFCVGPLWVRASAEGRARKAADIQMIDVELPRRTIGRSLGVPSPVEKSQPIPASKAGWYDVVDLESTPKVAPGA